MTQEDAQLLYDWLIATYGDPSTAAIKRNNDRGDDQAGDKDEGLRGIHERKNRNNHQAHNKAEREKHRQHAER
jgi:hypothetical protein